MSSWFILTNVLSKFYVYGVMLDSPSKRVYFSWLIALFFVWDVLVNSKIYFILWHYEITYQVDKLVEIALY